MTTDESFAACPASLPARTLLSVSLSDDFLVSGIVSEILKRRQIPKLARGVAGLCGFRHPFQRKPGFTELIVYLGRAGKKVICLGVPGTYPPRHGVDDFGAPLPASVPYLPELLRRRGYRTAAFVGSISIRIRGRRFRPRRPTSDPGTGSEQ
jgi:hypothetical protein